MSEDRPPKLFGRYHEVAMLGIGFLLTTVVGGLVSLAFKVAAEEREFLQDRRAQSYISAGKAADSISEILGKRQMAAKTLAFLLASEKDKAPPEEQIALARRAFNEANRSYEDAMSRNIAWLEVHFGCATRVRFVDEIKLKNYELAYHIDHRHMDVAKAEALYTELDRDLLQFNVDLYQAISLGRIGADREGMVVRDGALTQDLPPEVCRARIASPKRSILAPPPAGAAPKGP
jgi:hypothetical protein